MGEFNSPEAARPAQAESSLAVCAEHQSVSATGVPMGGGGSADEPRSGGAALNLDTPSHDVRKDQQGGKRDRQGKQEKERAGGGYQAKTFHYPDGGVETVAWSADSLPQGMPDPERREVRKALLQGFEGLIRVTKLRSEESVRRAKTKVRRLARSMGLDRMLTFTTREAVNSRDDLVEDWDRFRRELMRENPGFRYVAVVEPHPSNPGHFHIHVGVRGFHDVNVLRRCWHKVLRRRIKCEGSPGNVQVEKKRSGDPERLAKYLAKYLGKSMLDSEQGRKSYWHNRKAGEAIKCTRWVPAAESWDALLQEIAGDDCLVEVRWFNPHPGVLWACGQVPR